MGGQSPDFVSKKHSIPGSVQKCPESIDVDVILTKSGWLAKARVFCNFLCVFNRYGAGKMQIFDVQRLILKVFGGSWRRPGQALGDFWGSKQVFWDLAAKMTKIDRFLTSSWGPSWSPKIIFLVKNIEK